MARGNGGSVEIHAELLKRIKQFAQLHGRYNRAEISWEDCFHDGIVSFLALPKAARFCTDATVDEVWEKVKSTITHAVRESVRGQRKAKWQYSLEEFKGADESEEFDLLALLQVRTGKDESAISVPQDPAARFALAERCRQLLEQSLQKFIEEDDSGTAKAVLRMKGHKYVIGEYADSGKARDALRKAIRQVRDSCLPIYVNTMGGKARLDGRKTNVQFWVAVARDFVRNGRALPEFFYHDPLEALLLMERFQENRGADSTYKLESTDQAVMNRHYLDRKLALAA